MRADTNRRRRRLSGGHKAKLMYSQKNEEKQRMAKKRTRKTLMEKAKIWNINYIKKEELLRIQRTLI